MTGAPFVAVTGAATFLGRAVVARLRSEGWRVRQLARSLPDTYTPQVETVVGDLADETALRRLVKGVSVVVHCAGMAATKRVRDYYDVNVEGAYRLGGAIRAVAPTARLVVASSLAARFPWLSVNAASKADSEEALIEGARTSDWAVLRMGPVYGPADRKTMTLMRAATWPVMPVPNRHHARISLAHVSDAAAAVAAACAAPDKGVTWEIGDSPRPWMDIAKAVVRSVARSPIFVPVPPQLLIFGVMLTHPLGSDAVPLLSTGRLSELLHDDWAVRETRQPPRDIWKARLGLDAGLHEAAEWFRRNGWLPPVVNLAAAGSDPRRFKDPYRGQV